MSNTITAFFKGRVGVAEAVYQNDYGLVMNLDGLDLPAHFDCYFSTLEQDEAIPGIGADNQVVIPNDCLSRAGNVTLHIPLHTGQNDSEVEYIVYFKVIGRARPVDDGTPVQMTAIEQALALLQNPIGNIEQIVNEALAFTGDTFAEMQDKLDADQAAYESSMTSRADAFESGITSRQDTVESQFTNLTTNLKPNSADVLWTGKELSGTLTLSQSISNYDFIDIEFYKSNASGTDDFTITKRIPATAGIYWLRNFALDYDNKQVGFYEQKITLADRSITAEDSYNIDGSESAWTKQRAVYNLSFKRVLGIKMGKASNAELTDIRVGADSVTYTSAGEAVRKQFTNLKSDLFDIREPKENIGYLTQLSERKYTAGVYALPLNKSQLKIWGTGTGWVRLNILRGNAEATSSTPTFTNNLPAGTYTLKADTNILYVFYGTDWSSRTQWANGETITFTADTMIWLSTQTNSQVFGTESDPTIFNLELYEGSVSIDPTAIDKIARANIADIEPIEKIVHADFDTVKPYNILPKDIAFTPNTQIRRTTGEVEASTDGYLASDYIPIDASKEYLAVGEYVYLVGETGTGLITGGNRVWQQANVAFYDENKNFVATSSASTALAKAIPSNAKYVRMTAISASIIPYAVLVYGNNTSQLWLRYIEYRKEITKDCVFASSGMESLNMVMFGDSIVQGSPGLSHDGISFVDYANDYLRSNIINVGFGGTRMSQGSPDTVGLASFASLCETIVSNEADKWDALDAYATASEPYWDAHIATLKAIDWTKVQAIGLLYGANDWHNDVPVGDSYNENPLNYDGACAYGLKLLLTKYPHLQVIVFTPFFRIADGVNSDSANGAGLNMDDYSASLKHIQTMFHCPVIDSGNELGINRYTIYSYSATNDGTHPRKVLGLERIGRFYAESVKRYIQPY